MKKLLSQLSKSKNGAAQGAAGDVEPLPRPTTLGPERTLVTNGSMRRPRRPRETLDLNYTDYAPFAPQPPQLPQPPATKQAQLQADEALARQLATQEAAAAAGVPPTVVAPPPTPAPPTPLQPQPTPDWQRQNDAQFQAELDQVMAESIVQADYDDILRDIKLWIVDLSAALGDVEDAQGAARKRRADIDALLAETKPEDEEGRRKAQWLSDCHSELEARLQDLGWRLRPISDAVQKLKDLDTYVRKEQPPVSAARDDLDRIIAQLLEDLNVMGFAFHHPVGPLGRQPGEGPSAQDPLRELVQSLIEESLRMPPLPPRPAPAVEPAAVVNLIELDEEEAVVEEQQLPPPPEPEQQQQEEAEVQEEAEWATFEKAVAMPLPIVPLPIVVAEEEPSPPVTEEEEPPAAEEELPAAEEEPPAEEEEPPAEEEPPVAVEEKELEALAVLVPVVKLPEPEPGPGPEPEPEPEPEQQQGGEEEMVVEEAAPAPEEPLTPEPEPEVVLAPSPLLLPATPEPSSREPPREPPAVEAPPSPPQRSPPRSPARSVSSTRSRGRSPSPTPSMAYSVTSMYSVSGRLSKNRREHKPVERVRKFRLREAVKPQPGDAIRRLPRVVTLSHELQKGVVAEAVGWDLSRANPISPTRTMSNPPGFTGYSPTRTVAAPAAKFSPGLYPPTRVPPSMSRTEAATAAREAEEESAAASSQAAKAGPATQISPADLAQCAAEVAAFQPSALAEVSNFVADLKARGAGSACAPKEALQAAGWPTDKWAVLEEAAQVHDSLWDFVDKFSRWEVNPQAGTVLESRRLAAAIDAASVEVARVAYDHCTLRMRMAKRGIPWPQQLVVNLRWAAQHAAAQLMAFALEDVKEVGKSKKWQAAMVLQPLGHTALAAFKVHQFCGGLNNAATALFEQVEEVTTHYARMIDHRWLRDTKWA